MERLKKVGSLPRYFAKDVKNSRLGIGFEKLDRDVFDPKNAYDPAAEIGVKYVRLQSGWMRCEKEKGVYDFAWLDEVVDNLIARGMIPWLCLCYGNPLYTPLGNIIFGAVGCPPINSEEAREAWRRYVKATAAHFKGRIGLYEVWNEPDNAFSWKHCETDNKFNMDLTRNAAEYGLFAKETAIAVKEADSGAKVAAVSLAHPHDRFFYLNNVLATGIGPYIDYITFHIYSSHDDRRERSIRAIRALVDTYDPSIKLIQGESGAQSRSDGNGALKGFAWTPEKQTKMLLRTLICDLACDVEFTSYFSTMDMIEALHGRVDEKASYLDFGYFGVVSAEFDENGRATGNYGKKPAYYALANLASLMREDAKPTTIPFMPEEFPSKRTGLGDCIDESLKFYSFRLCDGRCAFFYWKPTHILTETYEGTTTISFFGQDNSCIRLVDLRDGSTYEFPENMKEDLGNGGIRLLNIPLLDSPLCILFGKGEQ